MRLSVTFVGALLATCLIPAHRAAANSSAQPAPAKNVKTIATDFGVRIDARTRKAAGTGTKAPEATHWDSQPTTGSGEVASVARSRVLTSGVVLAPDAAFPQLCGGVDVGPMCIVDGELPEATPATPAPAVPAPAGEPAVAPAPAGPDPYVLVSQALAKLTLPDAVPSISPDPANNEWGMLAVGLPVWFSSDEPVSVDASTTQQGIAITLVATKQSTTLDLGDGSTIVCASMTVRPISAPAMQKSPDCGHTYVTHGDYTITATTVWNLDWAALGQSGSFRMQMSGSSDLKVGELTSKVVR